MKIPNFDYFWSMLKMNNLQTKDSIMRSFLICCTILLFGTLSFAQPTNDNCSGAIDLGVLPACGNDIYTNVDATSQSGFDIPSCFNGGNVPRDVWFSFTTSDFSDLTITILGTDNGPNGQALINPQLALYRGDCSGVSELFCATSENGSTSVRAEITRLDLNTTYFFRLNDFSPSASPNSGDFLVCIEEFVPAINMGDVAQTNACSGTLFDSGGPDENYSGNENLTFTICPDQPHTCIELDLLSFNIDNLFPGLLGDQLSFYAGANTSAPLITTVTGTNNNDPFIIQASSQCVTVQFQSDLLVNAAGFELTWQCSPLQCDGSTFDNPTVISSIPFSGTNLSTCDGAATFATSPCGNDAFLNGPEDVYRFTSPGGICTNVRVSNAPLGTGVLVLDGPPNDPNTNCVAVSDVGLLGNVDMQVAGDYYIVVANAQGCVTYNLSVEEAECIIFPRLVNALCNPLNGCPEEDGLPSILKFQDNFQDLVIETTVNGGCWLGVGQEPDFIWFTIQARVDGLFGFILESAGNPSDIDFNVWGPFTPDNVCNDPDDVIDFIRNNQPLRSSWAQGADPTGMATINPLNNEIQNDAFDCDGNPGGSGDDFVAPISTTQDEVYVVLINDWGNEIGPEGISIDWSPSDLEVLGPLGVEVVMGADTSVCTGESVQLEIETTQSNNIEWIGNTSTLSCTDCLNPIATPDETTIYTAVVDGVCNDDTVSITVNVFSIDLGDDFSVCRGAEFNLVAGEEFENATYQWTAPAEIVLGCTDCPSPSLMTDTPGTYTVSVVLTSDNCTLTDDVTITVFDNDTPEYTISDDVDICLGDTINIGGPTEAGTTYSWSSVPAGFTSDISDPEVSPMETTTYFLSASNGDCPVPSIDSVLVTVFQPPVLNIISDTTICQDTELILGSTLTEDDVTYEWSGPSITGIEDASDPNSSAFLTLDGEYTLTATRGACTVTASFNLTITPIDIEIMQEDTVLICAGDETTLSVNIVPEGSVAIWSPSTGIQGDTVANEITVSPVESTWYFARVNVPGCFEIDSVFVAVDSLPVDLSVTPLDTMICVGSFAILESPVFEEANFPNITFQWTPNEGLQSQDTLYNLVVQPNQPDTIIYVRATQNGACVDTSGARVIVNPIPMVTVMPMDTIICRGESVDIVATTDIPVDEIMWTPMEGLSCMDCLTPTATPSQTTSYQVQVMANMCPGSGSTTITVSPLPLTGVIPNTPICLGESIQLNTAADQVSDYLWTSPDDPSFMSTNPFLEVSPTTTTNYVLSATNDCGTVEEMVTITVIGEAELIVPDDQIICSGDSITLSVDGTAPDGVAETFAWIWPTGSASGSTVTIGGLSNTSQVTVTYTYGPNCGTDTKSFEIQVVDVSDFSANIMSDRDTIFDGESITLVAVINPSGLQNLTYNWFEDGVAIGTTTEPTLTHTPGQTGLRSYSVTLVTPDGCEIESDMTQVLVQEINAIAPNIFTPDGDGENDIFRLFHNGFLDQIQIRIFNRWGQLVFEANDNSGWNGMHNGNPAPSDVYVFIIDYTIRGQEPGRASGDLTLLR